MRNKMGDQLLNDSLIVYLKNDIFTTIDNDTVIDRFQNIETR